MEAGLDLRRIWQREASGRSAAELRRRMEQISTDVAKGVSLTEAIATTGDYFPRLFRELVEVGEQSGQLPEVFRHLADHYDQQVSLRRTFLVALTWPAIQLGLVVFIVGFLIWVMGFIGKITHSEPIDILGFGLVGNSGLALYLLLVGGVAAMAAGAVSAARRGAAWTRPLLRGVMRLPVLGRALTTLALARLAWSLNLTLETDMPLTRALPLALRSTHHAEFIGHTDEIVRSVAAGDELAEAFANTGRFPTDFLEALHVGEQSGRLPETMTVLSRQYQEQAWSALKTLSVVGAFAVAALVALVIIALIFRLFAFYIGTIYDVLSWT
jgi:type IV pilus assembly protein PilC